MGTKQEKEEYQELVRYLEYTLHELPAGVLCGANGASERECSELMTATYRLEELAALLGEDVRHLLEICRWHYERYPHYLGRRRHFGSYSNYMEKHHAPAYGPAVRSTSGA